MNRLKDRVAVVTGGGSGIGRATCELFAEEGAAVVVAERDVLAAEETARRITEKGGRARAVPTDVANEEDVRRVAREAQEAFGPVSVLVNNAAVFIMRSVDASVEDWRRSLDVNVVGAALMAKHLVPQMRQVGHGTIVNVASQSSFIAQRGFVTYSTSKAAIAHMTRCLALDLAPDNIRVNAVAPGTIWTPTVERLSREAGLSKEAAASHPDWGGMHMIKRFGEPREVASAILFLASDESSFVTAACLMVDGGSTAQ